MTGWAPDADRIAQLLQRVEVEANLDGWDRDSADLLVLYDDTDDASTRVYGRALLPVPPVRFRGYAARYARHFANTSQLYRFARNLNSGAAVATALLGVLRQPGFVGAAFLSESWIFAGTAEQINAIPPGKVADTPGAREARDVFAADTAETTYVVHRVRGENPWTWRSDSPGRAVAEGAVTDALQMIVGAVTGRHPTSLSGFVPTGWPGARGPRVPTDRARP